MDPEVRAYMAKEAEEARKWKAAADARREEEAEAEAAAKELETEETPLTGDCIDCTGLHSTLHDP